MKTKKEIIEELKETAEQCKNKSNIEMLLKIAEICEKVSDDSRMHEATELEWQQYLMITNTMRCRNDRKIRNAKIVFNVYGIKRKTSGEGAQGWIKI